MHRIGKKCAPHLYLCYTHQHQRRCTRVTSANEERTRNTRCINKNAGQHAKQDKTRGRRENLTFGGSVEVLLMQRGPRSPKGGASAQLKRTKNKSTPNVSAMCTGHSSQRPSRKIAHRRCTRDVHVRGGWSRCMAVVQRLERLVDPCVNVRN